MESRILKTLLVSPVSPKKVRIITGEIVTDEGKCIGPGNELVLYDWGIKIYLSPLEIATFKERSNEQCNTCGPVYTNMGSCANHIFVSGSSKLRDNHFVGKTYHDVSSILSDLPRALKVNKNFFAQGGKHHNMVMRNVRKGEVIQIVSSVDSKDNALHGFVGKDNIIIPLNAELLDVTAVPDQHTADPIMQARKILQPTFKIPTEMVFDDEDIRTAFQVEVGFSILPLQNKPKFSICFSDEFGKNTLEAVNGKIDRIRNVRCCAVDVRKLEHITVDIIDENPASMFRPGFATEVDKDPEGFALYNVFGKTKAKHFITRTASLPDNKEKNESLLAAKSKVSPKSNSLPRNLSPMQSNLPSKSPKPAAKDSTTEKPASQIPRKAKCIQTKSLPPLPSTNEDHQTYQNTASEHYTSSQEQLKADDCWISFLPVEYQFYLGPDREALRRMTIAGLADFFRRNGLESMANLCFDHAIDGEVLIELKPDDLTDEPFYLSGDKLDKVKKLMFGQGSVK